MSGWAIWSVVEQSAKQIGIDQHVYLASWNSIFRRRAGPGCTGRQSVDDLSRGKILILLKLKSLDELNHLLSARHESAIA
jgi:hypothetical protein